MEKGDNMKKVSKGEFIEFINTQPDMSMSIHKNPKSTLRIYMSNKTDKFIASFESGETEEYKIVE